MLLSEVHSDLMNIEAQSSGSREKPPRTQRLTERDTGILEKYYRDVTKNPSMADREALAQLLEVERSSKQLNVWFANRRKKEKYPNGVSLSPKMKLLFPTLVQTDAIKKLKALLKQSPHATDEEIILWGEALGLNKDPHPPNVALTWVRVQRSEVGSIQRRSVSASESDGPSRSASIAQREHLPTPISPEPSHSLLSSTHVLPLSPVSPTIAFLPNHESDEETDDLDVRQQGTPSLQSTQDEKDELEYTPEPELDLERQEEPDDAMEIDDEQSHPFPSLQTSTLLIPRRRSTVTTTIVSDIQQLQSFQPPASSSTTETASSPSRPQPLILPPTNSTSKTLPPYDAVESTKLDPKHLTTVMTEELALFFNHPPNKEPIKDFWAYFDEVSKECAEACVYFEDTQ